MKRRRALAIGAGVGVGGLAFVAVWFQPQKLWIDDRVSEPVPVAAKAAPSPVDLARGAFVSREHTTTGVVRVIDIGGRRTVRIEGLRTSNGPDLYVYLSANQADGPEQAFDDDYVSLGRLAGNIGDQNYDVPVTADLSRLSTVVIWCDRFNAVFGAADLAAV
jgi:hypothetical protein